MSNVIDRLILRWDRYKNDRRINHLLGRLAACGKGSCIDFPTHISAPEKLQLGAHVSINAFVHIWAQGGIEIGDDTIIASHVSLTTLTHDTAAPIYRETLIARPIKIGRNVWIGTHAVILPGITIGDHAIIGAGAVVTHDIPAQSIALGVPARVTGQRPKA